MKSNHNIIHEPTTSKEFINSNKEITEINGYDFDGVLTTGCIPDKEDVIITGRSFQEQNTVNTFLKLQNIGNPVFFNPITPHSREQEGYKKANRISGEHKARTINQLKENGIVVKKFYEDNPIQAKIIQDNTSVELVLIK